MHHAIATKNILHTNILRNVRSLTFTRSFSYATPLHRSGPESSKIYALPFKLSPERAPQVVDLANYITEHKVLGLFRLVKSMLLKTLPQVSDTSHIQIKKAYLPFWYYDMAIKANVTRKSDNKEHEVLGVGLNNYWTGHTWDPLCYLSLGYPVSLDQKTLQSFAAISDMDDTDDVEIIPFTTDPFQDLAQHVSTALEGLDIGHGKLAVGINKAELVFGAAYPLYFPVYIAQVASDKDTVIVVGGHSENPPVYKYTPVKPKDANNGDNDGNDALTTTTSTTKDWLNNGEWMRLDSTDPTWRIGLPTSALQELCKTFVDKVVNKLGGDGGNALASKPRQAISWDDVRIQDYPTYQQANKDYIQQLYKVWAQQGMLTQLETMGDNQRTLGVGKNGLEMKSAEQFKEDILNTIGGDLQKLEQVEPQWLKDYNQQIIQENNKNKDQDEDH